MMDQPNFQASFKDTLCKSAIEIEDVGIVAMSLGEYSERMSIEPDIELNGLEEKEKGGEDERKKRSS